MLPLVCYLIAFVAFVLVAVGVAVPRISLLGVGLAAVVLPRLVAAFDAAG